MPKISIITICYNEPQLERTCESVAAQTFKDFEWIVIDGGSGALTLDIFAKYRENMAYFISEKDNGIYDAMNKGIARATGDWLLFLNAGDALYEPDSLKNAIPLSNAEKYDIIYGKLLVEHKDNPTIVFPDYKDIKDHFFVTECILHQGTFIKRELFEKYGAYRTDLRIASDWEKWIIFLKNGCRFYGIDVNIARFNCDGVSSTNWTRTMTERAIVTNENYPEVMAENVRPKIVALYFFKRILLIKSLKFRQRIACTLEHYRFIQNLQKMLAENKLMFIAHAYHKKTRSCDFMIDILKKHFQVDVFYDNSWRNRKTIKQYNRIVFWQNLPNARILWRLRHKNMFWFPMADAVLERTVRQWRGYARRVKIINFSKTIHDRLANAGIKSLYVQYFIKPAEFIPGNTDKVFFWQRRNEIDITKVIAALPDSSELKIHMHTAIDPEQKLTLPGDADKEKYSMTFSEWFDTKSDLISCIQAHGIYIAPRMAEGIGMSFLEALAMGKAIIAHNETTMNEYIENGVNGYLVDFDNPAPVDLSDVATVQKNAYDSAAAGYENWQSDQDKIIEFIKDKK